jgi:anti-sigma factor RsiW
MAEIIPLPGDRHRETLELLPWYLNGNLDAADRAKVKAHLEDCAECREELVFESRLRTEVAKLPLETESSFVEFRRRLAPMPPREPRRAHMLQMVRAAARMADRVTLKVAVQAAVVLLGVGIVVPSLLRPGPQPAYRTLSAGSLHPAANVLVMFRPETNEAELRALMMQNEARLVDGPSVTGAYMLEVPAARRASVIARLRAQPSVTLVQPIDRSPPS